MLYVALEVSDRSLVLAIGAPHEAGRTSKHKLAPLPWASGGVEREQGISKAGNAMVRKHLIQMVWRWIRYQPDSAIALWFRDCCSSRDGRSRRRGIVAVARRLLIALWRYATIGLVPTDAVMP